MCLIAQIRQTKLLKVRYYIVTVLIIRRRVLSANVRVVMLIHY